MTLGELLALDRVWDLANSGAVTELLKFGVNPLRGRPEGESARDLLFLASDAYDSISRRGFDGAERPGWRVWRQVVMSIRALLRSPPEWRNPPAMDRTLAAFSLSPFAWAPRIARRVSPPGTHACAALIHPLLCDKADVISTMHVVGFLSEQLTAVGAEGAFLEPEEVSIRYSPTLAGMVCQQCHSLIPRTKSGRISRRIRCERCQKAKEYTAWKGRDQEMARALWRGSKRAARLLAKGDET